MVLHDNKGNEGHSRKVMTNKDGHCSDQWSRRRTAEDDGAGENRDIDIAVNGGDGKGDPFTPHKLSER